MASSRSSLLLPLASSLLVAGLLSGAAAGQSLALSFRDDDGTVHTGGRLPVLRTGVLSVDVRLRTVEAMALDYAWAVYADGVLCCSTLTDGPSADPGSEPNLGNRIHGSESTTTSTAYYTFRADPGQKLVVDGGRGRAEIRYGHAGHLQLPIGEYALRFWAGRSSDLTFDGRTGVVTGGAMIDVSVPLHVDPVEFAIHTDDPRGIAFGQRTSFRVITADPVATDTYFTLTAPRELGELSVSQVLIPAGSTASAEFELLAGELRAEGQIAAMRDDGTQQTSPMLAITPELAAVSLSTSVSLPPKDGWAYCSQKATPISYGAGGEQCSTCARPAPSAPSMCLVTPGMAKAQFTTARCSFAFTTDCEFFTDTLNLSYYTAEPTYLKPCGSITTEVETGRSRIGRRRGVRIGSEVEITDQTIKWMNCCVIRYAFDAPTQVAQCRTV